MSLISNLLRVKEYSPEKAIRVAGISQYANVSLDETVNKSKCFIYAIVVFNKLLGRVVLFTDSENKDLTDGKNVCYLSNLWVHPRLRGKKIGSKLVNHVECEARKMGFKYLTLRVHKDNDKNVNIYKHLGFYIVDKDESHDMNDKDKNSKSTIVKKHLVMKKKL